MENQKTNYEKISNDSESSSKNKVASLAMGLPLWGLLIIDLVFAGWGFGFPSKLTFIIDALVFGILAYISYQHLLNKTNPINLVIRNYTPKDFLWTNILICALSLIMAFAMKR